MSCQLWRGEHEDERISVEQTAFYPRLCSLTHFRNFPFSPENEKKCKKTQKDDAIKKMPLLKAETGKMMMTRAGMK